jgi:mannose-6-phosphate isomerase-like protein (cupin superfamily)
MTNRTPGAGDPAEKDLPLTGKRGDRPWGYYLVLHEDEGYKVKKFVVRPGMRLSLQRHRKRMEHWHIVKGEGFVTLEGSTFTIPCGLSITIPVGGVHRVENRGTVDLEIVEVQLGPYVGEDDIERIEDDYGRSG